MRVDIEEMFTIIGRLYVENQVLRREVAAMAPEEEDEDLEEDDEQVDSGD